MLSVINILIPIFSVILIGYFFKRIKFPSYEFWPMADKLTYYVLMPSLLIYKLSSAKFTFEADIIKLIITPLIAISLVLFIAILLQKKLKFDGASFTSVVQGAIRFNTYVFLALVDVLFGNEGILYAAIILTFVIPYINILCVTVFALYTNENNKITFSYLIKTIITNPLIIACSIGGLISFFEIELFEMVSQTLKLLSATALPMGLLSVGFGLVLKDMSSYKNELIITNSLKHIIKPLLIYVIGTLLNLPNDMLIILVIFGVLPTAPSSFVLARQLGGNIQLMSSIITLQTLLSILFILVVLKTFLNYL